MYEPTKSETQELYLKIWLNFSVGHLSQEQLAKLFDCSVDTIANAIKWAAENRTKFDTPIYAEAAKEAVEARLRELKNDIIRVKESTPVNWNAVIGMNRLIQENEELLWKLQTVIQDKSLVTINNTTQVNQVLKAKDEIMEGMSDGERQQVISRIREVIGKQDNNQERSG
ncbi:MAG TPA: hypothetical protein DCL35_07355 [Candidatus Omnitrophica bacterium]|nr:hypothetical protein [Candidatus Omnitrophota bacterium]